EAPQPCCFKADVFDGAVFIVHINGITNLERFIEEDYEVVEQIAHNVLCSKCNGNTANAHPGKNGGNIVAEVIEQKYTAQYPDHQVDNDHQAANLFYFYFTVFLFAHIG